MTDVNIPAYPGAGGKNRAVQLRNRQDLHQRAADELEEQMQRSDKVTGVALDALDRTQSTRDRLRTMAKAEKGRNR